MFKSILRIRVLLYVLAVIALLVTLPGMLRTASAQDPAPTLVASPASGSVTSGNPSTVAKSSTSPGQADIVLSDLGIADYEMVSPSSLAQFRFRIPDNWEPRGLNTLQLAIDYSQTGLNLLAEKGATAIASVLKVYLDDKLLNTTYLPAEQQGPQTLSVQLPLAILSDQVRRIHTIRVILEAQEVCLVNAQVRVVIRTDQSILHLEYADLPPMLNLSQYPRPFYNNNFRLVSDHVTIVLPSNKTTEDLEAAAIVSAGLGRLSGNGVVIKTVDVESLTPEDRKENLILIGPLGRHPLIAQLYSDGKFPTTRALDGTVTTLGNQKITENDGILQIIANPENVMRAILAVTGQSPDAVKKAAQALTNSASNGLLSGSVALVANFQDVTIPQGPQTTMLTFGDLGYTDEDLTVQGRGIRFLEVDFNIPLDMRLTQEAYINLLYKYSNGVAGSRTSISLLMNGSPFASAFMENSRNNGQASPTPDVNQGTSLRAPIPVNFVTGGLQNRLSIVVETNGDWFCFAPSQTALFFSASSDSQLNLPLVAPNPDEINSQVIWFPSAFNRSQTLDDVVISLPTNPSPDEIDQVMRFASRLGAGTTGNRGFNPHIIIGDLPAGTDLAKYHLVVFGRPSTNPVLVSINGKLPQPFVGTTDEVQQVMDNVVYRLAENYAIGIVEIMRSPWSNNRLVLVVTGNNAAAQLHAGETLLNEETDRSKFTGDVVFIRETQLQPVNSKRMKEASGLLTAVPAFGTQVAQNQTATAQPPTSTPVPGQPTVTITPLYTLTPTATVVTPFPTFPPLSPDQANPVTSTRPAWIDGLFTVTLLILFGTAVYGLLRAMRRTQRH